MSASGRGRRSARACRCVRGAVAAASLIAPVPALAHGTLQDVGGFYGGMLHPALVPAHLVAILAAALFAGQRGGDFTRKALPAFIFSSLLAIPLTHRAIAHLFPLQAVLHAAPMLLLSAASLLGLLVATAARVPAAAGIALVAVVALVVSCDSAPDAAGVRRLPWLAGTAVAASSAFTWVSAPISGSARPWLRLAIRVAGSWLAAGSLMVLALMVNGRPFTVS